jgi:hypothetical protein
MDVRQHSEGRHYQPHRHLLLWPKAWKRQAGSPTTRPLGAGDRQKEKERLYLRGPMDDRCLLQSLAERGQQGKGQDARERRHRDGAKDRGTLGRGSHGCARGAPTHPVCLLEVATVATGDTCLRPGSLPAETACMQISRCREIAFFRARLNDDAVWGLDSVSLPTAQLRASQ